MFAKVLHEGKRPTITDDNLIEFACPDCRKSHPERIDIANVLHRFDILGECIESVIVFKDGSVEPFDG